MDIEVIDDNNESYQQNENDEYTTDDEYNQYDTVETQSTLPDPIIGMGTEMQDSLMENLITNPIDLDEIQA